MACTRARPQGSSGPRGLRNNLRQKPRGGVEEPDTGNAQWGPEGAGLHVATDKGHKKRVIYLPLEKEGDLGSTRFGGEKGPARSAR
jgi:hypothetical protein